jgi:hypothetical protein
LPPIDALWFDDPSFTTRTASDGSFLLDRVAAADALRVSAAGFRSRETSIEAATLRIALEPLPSVAFQVVDGGGRPLPWVELIAKQGPWRAYVYTEATGHASMAFEHPGGHLLEVYGARGELLDVAPKQIIAPEFGEQSVILRAQP